MQLALVAHSRAVMPATAPVPLPGVGLGGFAARPWPDFVELLQRLRGEVKLQRPHAALELGHGARADDRRAGSSPIGLGTGTRALDTWESVIHYYCLWESILH